MMFEGPIVILLIDQFPLSSLAATVEPLRTANRLLGIESYSWILASEDGNPVSASCGIEVGTKRFEDVAARAGMVLVCMGLRLESARNARLLASLRQCARRNIPLGGLSAGTLALAAAGLLEGYSCTIHWENRAALTEQFPRLACTDNLFEIDRNRLTCSGGSAATDMMLHLIRDRHGADLMRRVANNFHHDRIREKEAKQTAGSLPSMETLPLVLQRIVYRMRETLAEPRPISELAKEAGRSERQLERLFRRYMSTTPAETYLRLRVDRGRELLLYSDVSVFEIAVATGFASSSHFSQWLKRIYGKRPSELRRSAQGIAERELASSLG